MKGIYTLFLSRVAEGRSTEGRTVGVDRIAASAEGRIFGGRDGQSRGLVDEVGGLEMALARARTMAHLPADAKVQTVRATQSLLGKLSLDADEGQDDPTDSTASPSSVLAGSAAGLGAAAGLPLTPESWMRAADGLAPGFGPFASSLWSFTRGERALAALPYGIIVQ